MVACERNCNPMSCPEPVCEPGIKKKFEAGQIAKGCPVKEFNGDGASQQSYVVTSCRKEVQVKISDEASEKRIQKCPLPCPTGEMLDIFVAANK